MKGKGLVISHDPRNEGYLAHRHARALGLPTAPALTPAQVKAHRAWLWLDQNGYGACTAAGSLHLMADAPITHPGHNPVYSLLDHYHFIQAVDRESGNDFGPDGGATMVAMFEAGKRLGWWTGYYWIYDIPTLLDALRVAPVLAGTFWTSSMDNRSPEGICRVGTIRQYSDPGHCYCINGFNLKSRTSNKIPANCVRIHQSWGDGYWYLPIDDLYQLMRAEGEVGMPSEVKNF